MKHSVESMFIGTFKDNAVARSFYERLDGKKISEQTDFINEHPLVTVNYGWPSLRSLLEKRLKRGNESKSIG